MNLKRLIALVFLVSVFTACKTDKKEPIVAEETKKEAKAFDYNVEQFSDIKVLRYQIPGWDNLTLKEQKLVYYLTEAGLAGRDIMWDQNFRYNLKIRNALEKVYQKYHVEKANDDQWKAFETYLKRVWFSNGIHHHYSNDKIKPGFSSDYLRTLLDGANAKLEGDAFEVIFNDKDMKKVNQAKGVDNVLLSAVNFLWPKCY